MELTGLLPIIRRWLVVIIAATVMATLVGLVLGSSADKTYEARAQMLVGPLNTDSNTMRASGDLAQTYAQLATSGNVLGTVARDLGIPRSQLSSGVRATANSTTRFLAIRARSHDKKAAAAVANAVSLQLIELGRQDPSRPEGQLRVIDPANVPSSPVSPRLDLIVPLAAAAGLLGSLTLILLFEFLGDTVDTADDVEAMAGVPSLVVKRRRIKAGTDPYLRRVEPLRIIATQAGLSRPDVRCIVLTEAAGTEGSAALVVDLAEIWGERRNPVTLVDAGVGEITTWAGLDEGAGLAQVVDDPGMWVHPTPWIDTVEVLGAGTGRRNEAIDVETARRIVDELAGETGLVVVHAPPATSSAAALVWAQVADVTILLVRRSQARRTAIEEAAINLRTVHANLAFSVLHEGGRPAGRRFRAAPPIPGAGPGAASAPGPTFETGTEPDSDPEAVTETTEDRAPTTGDRTASAEPGNGEGTPRPSRSTNGSQRRRKSMPSSGGRP